MGAPGMGYASPMPGPMAGPMATSGGYQAPSVRLL